jgi:hypothetical protein
MAADTGRRKSENLCRKLYGSWDNTLVNCDEFPFASTYEGSRPAPNETVASTGSRYG